jgi:predicted MPP superfamily phosphohydrolase
MRSPLGVVIFLSFMLLLDLYVYQAVSVVLQTSSITIQTTTFIIYSSFTLLAVLGFLIIVYSKPAFLGKKIRTYLFAVIVGLFMAKILAACFFVIDDFRRAIQWMVQKPFFRVNDLAEGGNEYAIGRSVFLSWLGLALGGTLFGSLLYGFKNKYNYQVAKQKLSFKNLPQSFKGIKIVHISDIHAGSFSDKKAVEYGIQKINALNPDLILFTGDLVNDKSTEMDEYKELFGSLKAPLGVYSTLGNHDYGDYVQWPIDGISKEQNLENLKNIHADMGWRLLMNEHVVIEKEGDKIAVLGIENWSARARFPKHGKMHLAHKGTEEYAFKILLSHDPSHWQAEVKEKYKDVDLMLSGHTHGMQFGVEIPWLKWSPVQYVYKEWSGLYEDAHQKLYVNRGFGFLGYPGRVGILPEITLLELV